MARTAKITLDGVDYTIHAFNVKELREVTRILGNGNDAADKGYDILAIAMRRAEPPVELEDLEPKIPEVTAATNVILELAGIEIKPDPQAAAPAVS